MIFIQVLVSSIILFTMYKLFRVIIKSSKERRELNNLFLSSLNDKDDEQL
jgi:hypothetical protein